MLIADGLSAFGGALPWIFMFLVGHFSGGRGSWMRFHRLGYKAKEKTMNIREAAAF